MHEINLEDFVIRSYTLEGSWGKSNLECIRIYVKKVWLE